MVELAVSLPLLVLILLGIIDLGQAYVYGVAGQQGAREAARLGARGSAVTNQQILQRFIDAGLPATGGCGTATNTSSFTCTGASGSTWTLTVAFIDPTTGGAGTNASGQQVAVTAAGNLPLLTGPATTWIGINNIPIRGYATMVILE